MITKTQINQRLDYYSKLHEDWSDNGGIMPSKTAIKSARQFSRLLPENLISPCMYITSDGEIAFYWSESQNKVFVIIKPNGMASYNVNFNNIKKTSADNIVVTKTSLAQVIKVISSIFSKETATTS